MTQPATPTVQSTFCDFVPLEGSVWFNYDPQQNAANCKDTDRAEVYASRWSNKTYTGKLTAIDLNNVACAFVWMKEPNLSKARDLFKEASARGLGKIQTIEDNKRRAEELLGPDTPGVPAKPAGGPKGGGGGVRVRVPAIKPRPGVSIRGVEKSEGRARPVSRVGVPSAKRRKPPTQKTRLPGKTISRVGVPTAKIKKPSGKTTTSRPSSLKRTR